MMDIFEKALMFALKAHEGQVRKNENVPFILHPCEAAAIAATLTEDREVLAAVVLHDTVEDTDTSPDEIREAFGDRVADLVAGETEKKYEGMPKSESWKLRKDESLVHLKSAGDEGIRIMWLSDKLANMRSFARQHIKEGDGLWQHYNQKDKGLQEWYYRTVAEYLNDYSDTAAFKEYSVLLDIIFGG